MADADPASPGRALARWTIGRRGALRLGGVAVVGSLGGCSRAPAPTRPAETAAASGVRSVTQFSSTLTTPRWPGQQVRWRLAQPATPVGLVVALHGRGSSADYWFDELAAARHAARTRLAIAAVDGADLYWHHRRSGVDPGSMVLQDLLPRVRERGVATDRLGFIGFSMGGYGSLLLGSRLGATRVFGIATMSAALWERPGDSAPGAFDDREDFVRNDVFARTDILRRIPVRLACGTGDSFISANRAFARALPTAQTQFDAGGHTGEYWAARVGDCYSWLAKTADGTR